MDKRQPTPQETSLVALAVEPATPPKMELADLLVHKKTSTSVIRANRSP